MKSALQKIIRAAKTEPIRDRDELRSVVAETARTSYAIDTATLALDTKIQALREEEGGLIDKLGIQLKSLTARLAAWSKGHRKEEFGNRQSIVLDGHALRFRKSPGKVVPKEGGKDADVLAAVLEIDDDDTIADLVNFKPSLNKDGLKRLWNRGGESRALVESLGATVIFPEEFSFEPGHVEEAGDTTNSTTTA